MTTKAPNHADTAGIVPDAVFDANGIPRATTRSGHVAGPVRRLRWIDRAILVLAAITTKARR